MNTKSINSQETVGALMTGAQKVSSTESYGSISIISYEGDPIYLSYGKTDEIMRQVGAAIMQFVNLGFQVEKEDEGFWKATNDKKDYCSIQVESLEWNGIENEIDGMCESIRDYFEV